MSFADERRAACMETVSAKPMAAKKNRHTPPKNGMPFEAWAPNGADMLVGKDLGDYGRMTTPVWKPGAQATPERRRKT